MKTGGHVEAGYQVQKPGCAGVNYKFLFLFKIFKSDVCST